jgi:YD repeat-containing protein
VQLVTPGGVIAAEYAYDAFGNLLVKSNTGGVELLTTAQVAALGGGQRHPDGR